MAAPLIHRDQVIGVVYLDSRMAKGLFTEDDLGILQALANHVAIALETARAARVEMEKQAMAKDLEVSGAVQSLLLPRERSDSSEHGELAGFCQSAAQSGGDWWWYERLSRGRCLVILGDVSGHGVGAAMVTAVVASSFHAYRKGQGNLDDCANQVPALLENMNQHLWQLCQGEYSMTMAVVELDFERGKMVLWNAAHPPLFILKPDGEVETFGQAGTMLGSNSLELGIKERELREGERVFLFTDCAYEMKRPDGKGQIRLKGLHSMMRKFQEATGKLPLDQARDRLVGDFREILKTQVQEDDLTFILAQRKPGFDRVRELSHSTTPVS
jgi:serine phosphatase RsbU (regulator of sigma subunit)